MPPLTTYMYCNAYVNVIQVHVLSKYEVVRVWFCLYDVMFCVITFRKSELFLFLFLFGHLSVKYARVGFVILTVYMCMFCFILEFTHDKSTVEKQIYR